MHNPEKCHSDVELWQQRTSLCSSTCILKKLILESVGLLLINILSQPLTSHPDRQGILRPFTHRRRLWTADGAEVFSPRMQIPCSEKNNPFIFFPIKVHFFLNLLQSEYSSQSPIVSHNSGSPRSDRLKDVALGQQPPDSCCSVFSEEALGSVKEPRAVSPTS